jgi:glycogen debranching enzyme
MDFVVAKELSNHSYILSGKRAFLYRYCDTGFKNKWTGLWAMPHKFIEYFAFRINGEWLTTDNCISFGYNAASAHQFKLNELFVKELLFIPENMKSLVCILTVKNPSSGLKKLIVDLELAVNIREREENWHDRTYIKKVVENKIVINSPKGHLAFGSYPSGGLKTGEQYKDHYPGGELQRCFVPGVYTVETNISPESSRDILFIFSCGESESEAMANFEKTNDTLVSSYLEKNTAHLQLISNSQFNSGIDFLDRLFASSILATEKLAFESRLGFGYFAGYPWFTQFWGRDSGWIIPAVVDYSNFEAANKALRSLVKFQSKDGCIPNTIYMNGNVDYNSIDATPLWIIALHHYTTNSGDILFLKEVEGGLNKAIEWCEKREDNGFIDLEGKSTWMDTLAGRSKAIDVQAIYIESLKRAEHLFKLLGNDKKAKNIGSRAIRIENKFEKSFWDETERYYYDAIGSKTKTINPIFPVVFGIAMNHRDVLKRVESEEFTTPFGVRTVSKYEGIYNPVGYHTGSSWGWLVALVACAEFKYNRPEKGLEYLEMLFRNLNQDCLGAIGEAWNPENGSSTLFKDGKWEPGCCLQGWSSALVIRCIDEFMLGLKVDAFNRVITASPSLLDGMKIVRRKRIGNDYVDLVFRRSRGKLDVSYTSMDKKAYRVVVEPKLH